MIHCLQMLSIGHYKCLNCNTTKTNTGNEFVPSFINKYRDKSPSSSLTGLINRTSSKEDSFFIFYLYST